MAGVLRGDAVIDKLAAEGLRLLNFNLEAQSIASRSAPLTGRYPIRSGTHIAAVTDGPDGLTRWEVTTARALSDAGYATGMWGTWHRAATRRPGARSISGSTRRCGPPNRR